MAKELKLEGNVFSMPLADYIRENEYDIVPAFPEKSQQETETSYLDAFTSTKLPTRVGASAVIYADSMINGEDYRPDPTFDPVKVFNEGGHTEDEMPIISKMDNYMQYNTYKAYKDWQDDAEMRIAQSGAAGQIANFIGNVATDPTMYVGFGAAKMLNSGMSAYKALAISGAAGAAATEGLEQFADVAEQRSAAESMLFVGAGATVGAALGGAGPLYAKVMALKNGGKPFNESAVETVKAIDGLEDNTYKSLSADVVKNDPNLNRIFGAVPRFLAKQLSIVSPALRGQASDVPEIRDAYQKVFGTKLATEGNVLGEAQAPSMVEVKSLLDRKALGHINGIAADIRAFEKKGVKIDDDFWKRVGVKINDKEDLLNDATPETAMAKRILEAGDFIAKEADGIDGFNFRERFMPTMYSDAKIDANFKQLTEKMESFIKNERSNIPTAMSKAKAYAKQLEDRLARIEKGSDDGLKLTRLLEKQNDEIARLQAYQSMGDDEIADEALTMARNFRNGDFNEAQLLFRSADKKMPSHFKERLLEQKDMLDFMELNPLKFLSMYYRDVIPHVASGKVLGELSPDDFIKDIKKKLGQKAASDEKLAKELDRLKLTKIENNDDDLSKGWQDLSGMTQINAKSTMGDTTYHLIKSAKNITGALKLGASIFANIGEFMASSLTHSLKTNKAFVAEIAKWSTSPSLRTLKGERGKYLANAMSIVATHKTAKVFTDEYIERGAAGVTKVQKAAMGSSLLNHYSQMINGNSVWTGFSRDLFELSQEYGLKDSIERLSKGKVKGDELTSLSKLGIGKEHTGMLLEQIKKHSTTEDGVFLLNTKNWDNKQAKDLMELAIVRDTRAAFISPTVGDVPHLFHVPGFDLIFQFKSWATTATHTYALRSLQRRDAGALVGGSVYIGWGALTYMISEAAKGNEPPKDIDEILYAGVVNSGMLGVLPDYGGHYFMNRLFDLESGGAKFSEYKDALSLVTPPAASVATDVFGLTKPVRDVINGKSPELNDKFWKDFVDVLPVPFVKPYIKNELLK